MFNIKKMIREAIAEERRESFEKLDLVVGEVNQPGYLKITEDGQLEVRWNQESDFMGLANAMALLVTGQLNQIIHNTVYNRGLANVVPGDAARASAILEQWVNMVKDLRQNDLGSLFTQMNGEPASEEYDESDEPAVPAGDAFSGEGDED